MPRLILPQAFALIWVSLLAIGSVHAQITSIGDGTSTPIEGIGHDYIHLLSETVNPANGSVSLRIQMPTAKGRGITLPFALSYDSDLANVLFPQMFDTSWTYGGALGGGWGHSLPRESDAGARTVQVNPNDPTDTCNYNTDFVFQDPLGGQHALYLDYADLYSSGNEFCSGFGIGPSVPSGGDNFYEAALTSMNGAGAFIQVLGPDGTFYFMISGGTKGRLPGYVEDRNGNKITVQPIAPFTPPYSLTDDLGRTVVSWSGNATTATVTSSGFSYVLNSTSVSENFSVSPVQVNNPDPRIFCLSPSQAHQTLSVVQFLTLPNGQYYQFHYGANPYGLLDRIDYPTGASVAYTWTLSNQPSESATYTGYTASDGQVGWPVYPNACTYIYSVPVVASRTVSLNGVPVLSQRFSYTTNWAAGNVWNQKTTTVSTTDLVLNKTSQTVYTYAGVPAPSNSTIVPSSGTEVPVESTVQYYDWGGATPIRTVSKAWFDADKVACEVETLEDGVTSSGKWYAYSPFPGSKVIDVKEYDYGHVSATGCQSPSAPTPPNPTPPPANPTRETATTYVSIPPPLYQAPVSWAVPLAFLLPSTVITKDSSGNPVAETDYAYDETPTSPVAAIGHDDANFPAGSGIARGNLTTKTQKCFVGATGCTNAVTKYTYDQTGQVTSMTDPCGNSSCSDMAGGNHTTTFSYADNYTVLSGGQNVPYTPAGNTNAYLTGITDALGHITRFSYDFNNGQVTASTDQNSQSTTYLYNDSFARPTLVNYPDGGQTTESYNDAAPNPSVTRTQLMDTTPTLSITTTTVMDGMGHVVQSQLASDPDGADFTDTTYDGLGHVSKVSNPHRSGTLPTDGITTYVYDALGRTCLVAPPDAAVPTTCPTSAPANDVFTSYAGNCATVTDEAGKMRKSCSDALGRLTQVFEDPNGLNYETDYGYDALDNLLSVTQKGGASSANWRNRTFAYNSLSRLTNATNPESGTIAYTYDNNGNLQTKVAPAPNQTGSATVSTSYAYDALNRLTAKSYSDGTTPGATYDYDYAPFSCPPSGIGYSGGNEGSNGIGRRTAMCDSSGSTSWMYDAMGRIKYDNREFTGAVPPYAPDVTVTGGVAIIGVDRQYCNYLNGDPCGLIFGDVPNYEFFIDENAAGRVINAGDTQNLVMGGGGGHSSTYTPNGALATALIGWSDGPYNGTSISNTYNKRLQPVMLSASTASGASILNLTYNFRLGSGDNGNVFNITNNRDTNRTVTFSYDKLNRITQASTQGPNWGETYTIDAWGNLHHRSGVSGKTWYEPLACPPNTKNQLTTCSFTYDAAGNMTFDGNHHYTYDAENRVVSVDSGAYSYVYDGDGNRVKKCVGTSCASGTFYFRSSVDGSTLLESDLGGNYTEEYYSIQGQIAARIDLPSDVIHYYFHDQLGSTSIITDAVGNIQKEADYYPYGGEIPISGSDTNRYKFTGKERDSESGLDNFGFRHYASTMGRWMTPDPLNLTRARLVNPTNTLNKYVYGANNPLKYIDKDGKDITIFYRPPSGASGDYGHIMLGALNQATGKVGFLDYYPAGNVNGLGQGPGAFNTGNMSERAAQNADGKFATLTIQTSPEEAQKVLNLIDALKNGPTPDYSALTNNCTTVCEDVLQDLGLDFGDVFPSSYWADVYNNFSADAQAHPIWTRMMGVHGTPGNEYGNPRNYGGVTNFSQWLFTLYQNQQQQPQPKACVEAHDSSGQGTGTTCN